MGRRKSTRLEILFDNKMKPRDSLEVNPAPRAANWSYCSLYRASNQRAVTKLSAKSKNLENPPSRRSTEATPPGFHRPSNRRHAT
ncbi:hypothetical protein TNCV_347011 [Trichonephila clavipes]|nr:hypothetical protein TNCV_347011 [Trichonephila clavipes]